MTEEKEIKEVYDQAANDFLFTRTEGKERTGWQNREIEQPTMFELVSSNIKNLKLLDVGCGPGIHLKKYIEQGAVGFGIDISTEMIRLAKTYCPEGNFKPGSIYNLEFEDNSFDIITASFVLDHVLDLKKAIIEIKRVLKKDGLFIFSVPHPIIYMFRDSIMGDFKPSHSYFNKETAYTRIVNNGAKFSDFPRQLQEYFEPFLKEEFILLDFIENKPDESWKDKYKEFDTNRLKMPVLCFFKWKKIS